MKGRQRLYLQEYYKKNKDRLKAKAKKWAKQNPEARRRHIHNWNNRNKKKKWTERLSIALPSCYVFEGVNDEKLQEAKTRRIVLKLYKQAKAFENKMRWKALRKDFEAIYKMNIAA